MLLVPVTASAIPALIGKDGAVVSAMRATFNCSIKYVPLRCVLTAGGIHGEAPAIDFHLTRPRACLLAHLFARSLVRLLGCSPVCLSIAPNTAAHGTAAPAWWLA